MTWTGPDLTLAWRCLCRHNRAQHNFGRSACQVCTCRRFDRDATKKPVGTRTEEGPA